VKSLIKKILKFLCGDYSIYHVYTKSINRVSDSPPCPSGLRFTAIEKSDVEDNEEILIRDQAWYHGADTFAYGCIEGSRIVAVCYIWHGDRYRERNFWPLANREAKLIQIVTLPEMRGRGIAASLISYAAADVFNNGFHRIYARIWHSNFPSLKAFRTAGWRRTATVAELYPMRRRKPFRMTLPALTLSNEQ
jgi:RimJ/RimL family protein N-acetyltransferase